MTFPSPAPVSIPRFAPLRNAALSFDGTGAFAQAILPASSLPTAEEGIAPFSVSFWMNVPPPPPPAPPPASSGETSGQQAQAAQPPAFTPDGAQLVLELSGAKSGVMASILVDQKANLGFAWAAGDIAVVPLSPAKGLSYLGSWVFVSAAYTRSASTQGVAENLGSDASLLVTDGGPAPQTQTATSGSFLKLQADETMLTLRLGSSATPDVAGLSLYAGPAAVTAYRGMLTRVRLWNTALTAAQAQAVMYDNPIGPQDYQQQSLIADWRICEGYGPVAFDYANPGRPLIPKDYRPPAGHHMHLGAIQPDGVAADAPAWVIADVATLASQTSTGMLPLVTPSVAVT